MQVTMTNPHNGRRWRLRPYSNGLCLVIEKSPLGKVNKKNGKEIKSEFVSCDKYPMTWEHGLVSMLNMLMCDPEDNEEFELKSLDRLEAELSEAFIGWLGDIVVEVKR